MALTQLPDDILLNEHGWTRADLNVAIHALAPKNSAPAGLHFAHERHIVRSRARQAANEEAPEALGYVIPVNQRRLPSKTKTISEDDE